MSLSTNLGGTSEWKNTPSELFRHFQILSNELSVPKVLICPSDYNSRPEATNFQNDFESKGNSAISYFLGLDADETRPQMLLEGDRDIMDSRFGLPRNVAVIVNLGTNHNQQVGASWAGRIHRNRGNIGLGDGSVQQLTTGRLREQLRNTDDTTNRIGFP
jgi:prepilin-type processing-associated H-X9-DG protein